MARRRIYRLHPRGIAQIRNWLGRHWVEAMASFKAFADAGLGKEEDDRK